MQPGAPHLSVDYGTAWTQAVLVWPGGRWEPLTIDGQLGLSSAVHVDSASQIAAGEPAWRKAATEPDGFVPAPLEHLHGPDSGAVEIRGTQIAVADLVVATLQQVAAAAADRAGGPVGDVRMAVPAGWGPRRRTWLRHVAHRAGLGQPRLVETPVAAAQHWLAGGLQLPVGAFLLVCDLGAGCESTVLRRGPGGMEVLSTVADATAGAAAIDARLLTSTLNGAATSDGSRWIAAAGLRAAREALTQQAVVTVPMPAPAAPMVLHSQVVDDAAAPVHTRAAELAAQAVAAAELTPDRLAGVYLIGGASTPAAAAAIAARLGTVPHEVHQPAFAAVLGASDAGNTPGGASPDNNGSAAAPGYSDLPPLHRSAAVLVPGIASLTLLCQMLFTAEFSGGSPRYPSPTMSVWAMWGELSLAAVFVVVTALTLAPLISALLAQSQQRYDQQAHRGHLVSPGGGIGIAAAIALAGTALYGIVASVYVSLPIWLGLRWAVPHILPMLAVIAAIAWTARRVTHSWRDIDTLLAFPPSSVICAAAGMLLTSTWRVTALPDGVAPIFQAMGGMLIGVAIAILLVRHLVLRIVLGIVLGVLCIALAGASYRSLALTGGPGILAYLYAAAATAWAGYRLWIMSRYARTHAP